MEKIKFDQIKEIETPFYYYDLEVLKKTLEALTAAVDSSPFEVHYAIKANANSKLLSLIRSYGLGIDCVSGQEVSWALKNGFNAQKIAFAGVGKTDAEINLGLDENIFSFNVESIEELIVIEELAKAKGKTAAVALRLNPNVNAKTHHYITTGLEENKFGINVWEFERLFEILNKLSSVNVIGIHFHIGSQITDLTVFKNLCNRVNDLQKQFRNRGFDLSHINVGGGLGVNYQDPDSEMIPPFEEYFSIFRNFLDLYPKQKLHFELGRAVVAQCASLISKVLYVKQGINTNFAILDAGMTELIRPALYQSSHKIENLSSSSNEIKKYDVVGPICESSDCFGKSIDLPITKRNDIVAIRTTGAYGEVMASNYNLRDKVKSIYSDEV